MMLLVHSRVSRSPELLLLTACARVTWTPTDEARLSRCWQREPLDPDALCRLATWHGLGPLLYHHLSTRPEAAERLGPWWTTLTQQHLITLSHNLRRWQEFLRLSAALAAAGIDHVPLKGLLFMHTLYRDPALRPMDDTDLLVHEHQLKQALSLLDAHGYAVRDRQSLRFLQRWHYHVTLSPLRPGPFALELHWNLAPPRPRHVPIERFWERGVPLVIDGRRLLTWPTEEQLVALALHHRAPHQLRLRQLCDLHELLTQSIHAIDWNRVDRLASTCHVRQLLAWLLALVHDWFDDPIPAALRQPRIRDRRWDPQQPDGRRPALREDRLTRRALCRDYLLRFRLTDSPWDALRLACQSVPMRVARWAAVQRAPTATARRGTKTSDVPGDTAATHDAAPDPADNTTPVPLAAATPAPGDDQR